MCSLARNSSLRSISCFCRISKSLKQIFCLYFVIFLADRDINWLLMDGTHCDAEISTWYAVGMYCTGYPAIDVISGIGSHTGGRFTGLEKWIPAGRSGSWRSFLAGIGERVGVYSYRLSNGVSHVHIWLTPIKHTSECKGDLARDKKLVTVTLNVTRFPTE